MIIINTRDNNGLVGLVREAEKKPPLMAKPLRGGGGALREKELFLKLFFILLPLKNKIILL